jgi:hypothetical protein
MLIVGSTFVKEETTLELLANHLNYLARSIKKKNPRIHLNTLVELIGTLIFIGFDLR